MKEKVEDKYFLYIVHTNIFSVPTKREQQNSIWRFNT